MHTVNVKVHVQQNNVSSDTKQCFFASVMPDKKMFSCKSLRFTGNKPMEIAQRRYVGGRNASSAGLCVAVRWTTTGHHPKVLGS
jgi:hypothetical protein